MNVNCFTLFFGGWVDISEKRREKEKREEKRDFFLPKWVKNEN